MALGPFRSEFNSAPEVEVAHVRLDSKAQLAATDVVLIAVHYRPERTAALRPAAGVYASLLRLRIGLPLRTYEEGSHRALNRSDSSHRLRVAWSNLVPDSPDIFPSFVANAVEEGELQVVDLAVVPAVADVHHMPGLHPLKGTQRRRIGILPVTPLHVVPRQGFEGSRESMLGFERQRMSRCIGRGPECAGNSSKRVAVDAVRSHFSHQFGRHVPVGEAGISRALVPGHERKE